MLGINGANRPDKVRFQAILMAALLFTLAGCSHIDVPAAATRPPSTLTVAFGLGTGQGSEAGFAQTAVLISEEALFGATREGRPQPRLAESWRLSPDGLLLQIRLRSGATFHDEQPVTAGAVKRVLDRELPSVLRSAYSDIQEIRASSPVDLEIALRRRSRFVLEALSDQPIEGVELPSKFPNGTGPFKVTQSSAKEIGLVAHDTYYGGKPSIEQIAIKTYGSVRAAWAEMLRGQVDMLYEIGADAVDLLESSNAIQVIKHQRNYQYAVLLNVQRPLFRDREFRKLLNSAIDRDRLVSEALKGYGIPAVGTILPTNWAYDSSGPAFAYQPRAVSTPRQFSCIVVDASMDHIALLVQQQLHAIGVDMRLESTTIDDMRKRIPSIDFDAILIDAQLGPTLLQPYRFWTPGVDGSWGRNWAHFDSPEVNAAFDRIRGAADDDAYRAGVRELQRAITDDPPAIFLAWTQRARAVSARFDVPVEPGRDILGTLRQWRPLPQLASRN
jgi:peptide/nickel transport system substrate-binding protein